MKKSKIPPDTLPSTALLAAAVSDARDRGDALSSLVGDAVVTNAIIEMGDLSLELEETRPELSRITSVWAVLLEMAQSAESDLSVREAQLSLVTENIEALNAGLSGDPEALNQLSDLCEQAFCQWGDTLRWLLDDATLNESDTDELGMETLSDDELAELDELEFALLEAEEGIEDAGEGEGLCDGPDPMQLEQALAAMAERTHVAEESVAEQTNEPKAEPTVSPKNSPATNGLVETIDAELLEAFMDDAQRCLAGLEEASFALESESQDKAAVKQVGRELHTLKGASACVGLQQLASQIHQAEELLQVDPIDVADLLARIDDISRSIEALGGGSVKRATTSEMSPARESPASPNRDQPRSENQPALNTGAGGETTQRIRTSQLDRLMDMLAELVMLRNRRQSGVDQLGHIDEGLARSVDQLKRLTSKFAQSFDGLATDDLAGCEATVGSLAEVAEDLTYALRELRGFYEPLATDNESVSRFIGQFRHELAALRRMPVSGLFHKLRRVARDAARVENKEIQLNFVGEFFGLEPAIQERLYEPLMHIIRNSVSHGIESPEQRVAAGKPSAGQVTLEASGSAHLVHIEIRDDGRGLDYEAIRRRGVERKLLSPNRPAGREELAQLIFNPGFSTRDTVSQISGRGVGMDVVASTLEQMRGWIDVSSTQDKGTTIRVSLPLPSVIQHMMVFRAAGQLYGVPMEILEFAGAQDLEGEAESEAPSAAALLSNVEFGSDDIDRAKSNDVQEWLWIQTETSSAATIAVKGQGTTRIAAPLKVDEVVGPEEAVVRPLPPLLRHHPLVSGLSLSGNGEVVQFLDSHGLARQLGGPPPADDTDETKKDAASAADRVEAKAVLVVDDSKTARLRIAKPIASAGIEVCQACDGAEALELLANKSFAAVFTDLEMPVMDGFELMTELRALNEPIPIIVASTLQHESHRQRTESLGAAAHLGKPIDESMVIDALRKWAPQLGL